MGETVACRARRPAFGAGRSLVLVTVLVSVLVLAAARPGPAARAEMLALPPFDVPLGALAVADYWVVGQVATDQPGRSVTVRVMRLQVQGEAPQYSVELRLPPAEPDGFEAAALIPESELAATVQALTGMLQPGRRAELDGRDESTMLYSPVPDLVVAVSRRAGGAQRAELFIQGEAVPLRMERGLVQLRDLLARAQGRIRDLQQRS